MSSRYGLARLLLLVFWLFFVSGSNFEDEQDIQEFYTQEVKQQILSELELSGPPPQPLDAGEAAQRMKEDEDGPWWNERLLHPKIRDGVACPATTDTTCFEFRFEFDPTLNGSALDLWVYWEGLAPLGTLSVTLSLTSGRTRSFHNNFEVHSTKWNKLRLTSALALPDSWEKGAALVQIVVRDSERLVAQPYLMSSRRKPPSIPDRRRRDADDLETSDACILRPLNVSFSEMGLGFVLHPPVLQMNVCEGGCQTGQGAGRTVYERVLSLVLKKNAALREAMGDCWSSFCRPEGYGDVHIIYADAENILHDQVLPDLIVESCACS